MSDTPPARAALVVHGDASTSHAIAEVMTDAGATRVDQTPLASDAIQLAALVKPQVIILGRGLLGMSGDEAVAPLTAAAPDAAIVVVTAEDDPEVDPGLLARHVYIAVPASDADRLRDLVHPLLHQSGVESDPLHSLLTRLIDDAES